MQMVRVVVEQQLKEGVGGGIGDEVEVVDDEDDGTGGGGEFGAQHAHALGRAVVTAAVEAEDGLQGGDEGEQLVSEAVQAALGVERFVEREPCHVGLLRRREGCERTNPVRSEHALAVASRGDDADQAASGPVAEQFQKTMPRDGIAAGSWDGVHAVTRWIVATPIEGWGEKGEKKTGNIRVTIGQ